MKPKALIKELEKHMAAVAKTRDDLKDYIDRASDLKESCDRAYTSLEDARDALSELV